MPSDESKGSQLDAMGSLAQRQLDNTVGLYRSCAPRQLPDTISFSRRQTTALLLGRGLLSVLRYHLHHRLAPRNELFYFVVRERPVDETLQVSACRSE